MSVWQAQLLVPLPCCLAPDFLVEGPWRCIQPMQHFVSPSATLRLLFRADVTSTIRALLKELCGNFLWCCLVEVSPARTTRLAWNLQPRSRLGTLKDHWTTCWCQDQGTESTYRLNDTSGNRWLKGPGQDYASSNYEQRNLWELLSSSVPKSPVLKRACPFKRAFGENRPFFARFFKILPVFLGFWRHST